MKQITKITVIILIAFCSTILAQKQDYSKYKGYINFGDLGSFDKGDNVTEVLFEENLLKVMAKLFKSSDKELMDALLGIKLLKAQIIEINSKDAESIKNKMSTIAKELDSKGWNQIVKSRQKGDLSFVFMLSNNDSQINGLAVMLLNKKDKSDVGEASFINLVGDIDMEAIGKIGKKFNIDALNNIK